MILRLNHIDVACIIGERADERDRLQSLQIDVELTIPNTAGRTDCLADTVNYASLTEDIRRALIAAKCQMIERAAQIVLDLLPTKKAKVIVTKKGAIPFLESASVILEKAE